MSLYVNYTSSLQWSHRCNTKSDAAFQFISDCHSSSMSVSVISAWQGASKTSVVFRRCRRMLCCFVVFFYWVFGGPTDRKALSYRLIHFGRILREDTFLKTSNNSTKVLKHVILIEFFCGFALFLNFAHKATFY